VASFFLNYLFLPLVVLLTILAVSLTVFSVTHRLLCWYPPIAEVIGSTCDTWSTPPPTSRPMTELSTPLDQSSDHLKHLLSNEYFETLPLALATNGRSMRQLSIIVEYNQSVIPSKSLATTKMRQYAEDCDQKSENIIELWSALSITITTILSERQILIRKLRASHENEAAIGWAHFLLDGPETAFAIVSTYLGYPRPSPIETRCLNGENERVQLFDLFLTRWGKLLEQLADHVSRNFVDFAKMNLAVYEIEEILQMDFREVSSSRDVVGSRGRIAGDIVGFFPLGYR